MPQVPTSQYVGEVHEGDLLCGACNNPAHCGGASARLCWPAGLVHQPKLPRQPYLDQGVPGIPCIIGWQINMRTHKASAALDRATS